MRTSIIKTHPVKDKNLLVFITISLEANLKESYKECMKTLILTLLLASSALFASEFQMIDGDEAYQLYTSLPGVRCTEWNSQDFVVYTKYQTASCDQQGKDTDWTCTIQVNKHNPAQKYESTSCTRQVP